MQRSEAKAASPRPPPIWREGRGLWPESEASMGSEELVGSQAETIVGSLP